MPEELADSGIPNHVLPRRAAARRASKLAAEQLESSPDLSDAENDGAVTFGEPSTPKGGVRVTYGGKRKSRPSPSKSSPSHAAGRNRARPKSTSLTEESPGKPRRGAHGRGASRSRAGRKTQSTTKKSLSLTIDDKNDESPDLEAIDVDATAGHTSGIGAKKQSARAAAISGRGADTTAASEKGSKKRPLSSSSSESEGSPLTPPSSPEARKASESRTMPVLAPRLARQFMRSQSHADTTTGSAKKTLLKHSKSFDHLFVLDSSDDESSDELDFGDLVWVNIDLHGKLTDTNAGGDGDTMWWPAKVDLPKPCMRVSLFGDPPGHTDPGNRQLDITNPSTLNVRSLHHNGRIRFNEANYRSSPRQSVQSSPRKRRKLDLDAAWRGARDLMLAEDTGRNADHASHGTAAGSSQMGTSSSASRRRKANPFPSLESGKTKDKGKSRSNGKRSKGKGKGKDEDLSSDFGDDIVSLDFQRSSQRVWRAPSANPLLEIPGELVLARDSKRQDHWPAKILEYIKPQHSRQRPKYKVLFFDGTILAIDPDMFWTTTDDEFATCRLGESKDNYGLDSDIDAADEDDKAEDFNRPFASEDEAELRAPSPLPPLPPPAPEVFEYDLSIAEQFEYVKPVLAAVLEGRYGPAMQRHEGFMRGAGARRKILDSVPLRGSLSAKEKEEVAYLVRSWAKRRERRREMGLSTEYPHERLYPSDSGAPCGATEHDDDDADSVLTPASDTSGGDTEPLALFDAEPPPSSFAATEADTDDDTRLQNPPSDAPAHEENHFAQVQGSSTALPDAMTTKFVGSGDDHMATEPVAGARGNDVADETLRTASRLSYDDLDAVEKITYCNNVLLQEAILQLLLWRTGQRKTLGLLSPEEEQRLHDVALEEGEKTNWVHDILRMRQAVEKTMLPTFKGKGKAGEPVPGVRARTRRGA
ncbi:hypothetical protein PYCCODRAFT_1448687 [Trametes coccinea BRFM310]|uniref:PWWP domain-containing protein n=1 Tax=Trametes coccinea (strain BRFM310) TaxID=1353009 RepID=A0A1Y2J4X2_TRAC3|nr:hypothetical protein PYCCODRAFT_1448687 [Trametes coccinea BRFM310]